MTLASSNDGSRTVCGWGQDPGVPEGIFAPTNGPWMIRTDYAGNSNDSYWLTNARALLTGPGPGGFSPLYGRTGVEQKLYARGLQASRGSVGAQQAIAAVGRAQMAFANSVHAAELVLPQLLQAWDQLGLYSKKQWPVLLFTAERIRADPNYMVTTLAQ